MFNVDIEFTLHFSQVFKNSDPGINGLTGTASEAFLTNNNTAVVASLYDGALTLFSADNTRYQHIATVSDGLSYERVFDSKVPAGNADTLGLLGAW